MRSALVAVAVALAVLAGAPAAAQAPDSAAAAVPVPGLADAYRDAAARELVARIRERRGRTDYRITAYETQVSDRVSVGLRALTRERLLYRREVVSRVAWERDGPVRIEALAAREVLPPATPRVQVPGDLTGYLPSIAFDPVESEILLRLDDSSILHPLAAGGEAHYRFRSGDESSIRLQDGRTIRLRELQIEPRRRDPQLVSGSFWVDAESYAVVRALFRLARPFDSLRDGRRSVTGALMGPVRAEVEYIAVEYGFWDLQWWLPRLVAAEGTVEFGRMRMPLRFERTYGDYTVTATPPDVLAALDTAGLPPAERCRPRTTIQVGVSAGSASDTIARPDTIFGREHRIEACDRV
jgi:hypothetical protein